MKVKIRTYKKRIEPQRKYLLLFIFLTLSLFLILSFMPKNKPPLKVKRDIPLPKILDNTPPLIENIKTIRRGMTLTDLLAQYNFTPAQIYELRKNIKPVYDLGKIKAGHELRIYSTQQGEISSLEYDINEENFLHIQKKESTYTAEIKKIPYKIEVKMIWGTIEENLIFAVNKKDEGDLLAINLADLFAWDIDFYADLRKGDSFKIIFEKKYLRGEFFSYRNILAAEFTNQGKTFRAIRYTYPDTKESDFFELAGNSLRKEFRKSPLHSARITSRFSHRRLHPIRKVYRPHYGVDYAAPVGTRVQATADGTVTFTGRNGAAGRMIKIRHKNRYETQYLHLRGYAKGIRKGKKIKEGQIIGFVGSSGESTGPHLDYRIKKDGRYINPLAFKPAPVKPLRAEYLEDFKKQADSLFFCLKAPFMVFPSLRNTLTP